VTKIVINNDWGGFGLTDEQMQQYNDLAGLGLVFKTADKPTSFFTGHWYKPDGEWFSDRDIPRDDPHLVAVVEGSDPEKHTLKVVEVPEDVKWHISEYDGHEHVAEDHRTWY